MTYLTIVLALLNVTCVVLGAVFFQPIRRAIARSAGNQPVTVESEADRSAALFKSIHDALSLHASELSSVDSEGLAAGDGQRPSHLWVEEMRRSNQATGESLHENNQQLATLLRNYGDVYRMERQRIESYAQNVGELDGLLAEFQQEADRGDRILLQLVRDMLQENRQLQSKVSNCQEQVSELIVRSVKSEREARTDALTRLPNRRAWDEQLAVLNSPTSIALIDVDDFKLVNDRYGHAAGDAMLTLIGTILRNCSDVSAYRIGGDEFALLIPCSGYEQQVAERVRKKIVTAVLQFANERISVSVSIGVSARTGNDAMESVLRRADDALYAAKELRGNQVQSAQLV